MTTQTFETSKGTLLAIKLPEGAKKIRIHHNSLIYFLGSVNHLYPVKLPPFDWKEIGLWGSVPEEKAKEVVDDESVGLYVDYTAASDFGKKRRFDTALESLQSLLQTKIPLTHDFPEPNPEDYFNVNAPVNELTEEDEKGLSRYGADLLKWESGDGKVWRHFYLIFKTKQDGKPIASTDRKANN